MAKGRRTLLVGLNVMIEFLKAHDGAARSYTVARPLPDDVQVVGINSRASDCMVGVVLESAAWEWDDDKPMDPPEMTVHIAPIRSGREAV